MEQIHETVCDDAATVNPDGPLSPEDVAAYLDGRLRGADLERVEATLARNPDSRAELVEASRLISTLPQQRRPSRRQWLWASAAAAAAILVTVTVPSLSRRPAATRIKTERRAAQETAASLRIAAPADGTIITPEDLHFVWSSITGASYQLTITDAEGSTIWRESTSDTTATLPERVKIVAPGTYYWSVDALGADGASTTTGIHELRVTAK